MSALWQAGTILKWLLDGPLWAHQNHESFSYIDPISWPFKLKFHPNVCTSFHRTTRRGWTCDSWRPNLESVTSPTRAMTAVGSCMPKSKTCPILLTLFPLLLLRKVGMMQMCKASQTGSAFSEHRETKDSFRKEVEDYYGLPWDTETRSGRTIGL